MTQKQLQHQRLRTHKSCNPGAVCTTCRQLTDSRYLLCSWAAPSLLQQLPISKLGRGLPESCKFPLSQNVAFCLPLRSTEGPPPWRESLDSEASATQHQPFPASLLHRLCSPLTGRLAAPLSGSSFDVCPHRKPKCLKPGARMKLSSF